MTFQERLDGLPPLRDVINRYNVRAAKALGQNFILDLNITRKIVKASGDMTDCTVVEIGPGPGGLTRALLESNAKKIIAIEQDKRCIDALQDLVVLADGRLEVIHGDALKIDIHELGPSPLKIVANLPYNVATALLLKWMGNVNHFKTMTLMFQKEVADRIVAPRDTSEYGRLSIIVQWLADVDVLFDLPPSVFTPAPKVTSSVVHIKPLQNPRFECKKENLELLTRIAFSQRRKMLRASLKSLFPKTEDFLTSLNINPTARAETLTIEEFCRLAQHIKSPLKP